MNESAAVHDVALSDHAIFFEQPTKVFRFGAWRKRSDENFCTLKDMKSYYLEMGKLFDWMWIETWPEQFQALSFPTLNNKNSNFC